MRPITCIALLVNCLYYLIVLLVANYIAYCKYMRNKPNILVACRYQGNNCSEAFKVIKQIVTNSLLTEY